MNTIFSKALIIAILLLSASSQSFAQNDSGPRIKITQLEGTLRTQKPTSEGWLKADTGKVLGEREVVSSGEESRAVFEFLDGQIIRIGAQSSFSYVPSEFDTSVAAFTFMPGPGDIWVNFGSIPVARSIIAAATFKEGRALIVPLLDSLPAIFRMETGTDSTFELKVYRGLLYMTFDDINPVTDSLNPYRLPEYNTPKIYGETKLGEGTLVVQSYQKLILTSWGGVVFKGAFAPTDPDEQIEWVEWNRNKDSQTQ